MIFFRPIVVTLAFMLALAACSDPAPSEPAQPEIDPRLVGDATLTVTGMPEGVKVVTMAWFPGRKDDDPQGVIYPYSNGVTVPAGKYIFLIQGKGYEDLMARRIPVYGNTVLEAKMCKLDEGCYGTLVDITQRK